MTTISNKSICDMREDVNYWRGSYHQWAGWAKLAREQGDYSTTGYTYCMVRKWRARKFLEMHVNTLTDALLKRGILKTDPRRNSNV